MKIGANSNFSPRNTQRNTTFTNFKLSISLIQNNIFTNFCKKFISVN